MKKIILITTVFLTACANEPVKTQISNDIILNNSMAHDVIQHVITENGCSVHHQNYIGVDSNGKPLYEMQQHDIPCPPVK